jgi:hypothetical protein
MSEQGRGRSASDMACGLVWIPVCAFILYNLGELSYLLADMRREFAASPPTFLGVCTFFAIGIANMRHAKEYPDTVNWVVTSAGIVLMALCWLAASLWDT